MMATIETSVSVVLELSETEAQWLKDAMENALREFEPATDTRIRTDLWNALDVAGVH